MLIVQNVFIILTVLLSLFLGIKRKYDLVLLIVIIGTVNGPLLKFSGIALPFYYLTIIPLGFCLLTNLENGVLLFSLKSKEAIYPIMLFSIMLLSLTSTFIIEKTILLNEVLVQSFVGAFFRFLWLLLVLNLLELMNKENLPKLINLTLIILLLGNLLALIIQLFFGFPEVFYNLYYSPSVTPLRGPYISGSFHRGYGLFPSSVNLGPFSVLMAALALSLKKYLLFFGSIFVGLLSLSKSAILGIPAVFALWLISKFFGFNESNKILGRKQKIVIYVVTILVIFLLPLFINIMEQKGFFVTYYLNYLTNPTKALSSRYDVDNPNIWLYETYEAIKKYPLFGSGYTRISNENMGDSTYVVLLKQTGIFGLSIYLVAMMAITVFFIKRKSMLFLIPVITLISGIGKNTLLSFEYMFFIEAAIFLEKSMINDFRIVPFKNK